VRGRERREKNRRRERREEGEEEGRKEGKHEVGPLSQSEHQHSTYLFGEARSLHTYIQAINKPPTCQVRGDDPQ
jgi:hypothetical protein